MEASRKRLSGRQVVLGFGLFVLALVAVVIGLWYFGRTPDGPIHAFTPVDDRHVLLVREGYRQKHYEHLVHADVERGPLWSVPFHGVPRGASPAVAGGRVALFVRDEDRRLTLVAHELVSGEFAFHALDLAVPPRVTPQVALVAIDGRFVAAYHLSQTHVVVVDPADGRVVVDHTLDGSTHVPRLQVSEHVVSVRTRDGIERILDPAAGTLVAAPFGVARPGARGTHPELPFTLRVEDSGRVVPMLPPALSGSVYWVVAGRSFAAIDARTGRVIGSSGPASFVSTPRGAH